MDISGQINQCTAKTSRLGDVMRWFFLAMVFLAIFSPTAVYFSVLSIVLLFFYPTMRAQLPKLFSLAPVRLGLLYLFIVLIGIFYTPAVPMDIGKEILVVVLFTILLPLWLPAFEDSAWQKRLLFTLLASVLFLSLVMIADFYHLISWNWRHWVFLFRLHYIQQEATLIALGIYMALHLGMNQVTRRRKALFMVVAFFLLVVSLVFQHERVGMVLALVALLLFCVLHLRCWKWMIVLLAGFCLIFILAYRYSAPSRYKIDLLVHSAKTLHTNPNTSLSIRWNTAHAGLQAAGEKSTFGFGTGVFSSGQQSVPPLPNQPEAWKLLNALKPEVGSIYVLLRHGWVGLLVFISFLFSWWWVSRPLGFERSSLVFSTLTILTLADCSYPAYYHSRAWVWLFAVLIATMGNHFSQQGHTTHEDTALPNR